MLLIVLVSFSFSISRSQLVFGLSLAKHDIYFLLFCISIYCGVIGLSTMMLRQVLSFGLLGLSFSKQLTSHFMRLLVGFCFSVLTSVYSLFTNETYLVYLRWNSASRIALRGKWVVWWLIVYLHWFALG